MKSLKILTIIFVLLMTATSFAQDYKYGKVSKEELLERVHPLDSTANASILYENKKIYYDYNSEYGFVLITEVFKRIKLYNKNGFDYASEEVFLYDGNGVEERISGLTGTTYSISGDNIIETKLKKDGIFKVEDSDYVNKVSFTMPAIKEGSIIEYKYRVSSPFSRSIDRIVLQYDIPIKKIEVSLKIPEYYTFRKRSTGLLAIDLKEVLGSQNEYINGSLINFRITNYKVNTKNVPAFKMEPYSGNYKNYISTLSFELQTTQFPFSRIRNYGTTWEAIARGAFKDARFGGAMDNYKYFKDDIDQLISGVSSSKEKAKLIYNYVRDQMTWNNRNALVPRKNMKKVYQERVGNAAEINLMLIAMLKYAKIYVKPILVTSSDRPLSLFPTIQGLDYVIARVNINNELFFLDATDKFGEPNVLPDRVIHGLGRVIMENGNSGMVLFRPSEVSKKQSLVMCEISDDGNVKGKQRIKHTFYDAYNFRTQNASKKEDEIVKTLKGFYGIQNISEYKVNNIENIGMPVTESFAFETTDEVEIIGNEMFFSPLLFLRNKENIFKSNSREYPVDMGYGLSKSYSVSIKIPEGYQIIEKPEDIGFQLPENIGSFVMRMNVVGNTIQLTASETLSSPMVTEKHYQALKRFYDLLIEKENEQVVLRKI